MVKYVPIYSSISNGFEQFLHTEAHPETTLVQEEHVGNDLHHDRLAGSRNDTIASTSSQQALVTTRQSLPDVGEDHPKAEDDADWTTAKDVA